MQDLFPSQVAKRMLNRKAGHPVRGTLRFLISLPLLFSSCKHAFSHCYRAWSQRPASAWKRDLPETLGSALCSATGSESSRHLSCSAPQFAKQAYLAWQCHPQRQATQAQDTRTLQKKGFFLGGGGVFSCRRGCCPLMLCHSIPTPAGRAMELTMNLSRNKTTENQLCFCGRRMMFSVWAV